MALQNLVRYHLPALFWAAFILAATLLPTHALPPLPHWELLSFDSFCHAAVFALLFFLVIRVFYFHFGANGLAYAMIFSFLLCFFFGIIIELLQMYMKAGRYGEVSDVISNTIGEVLGAVFFYYLAVKKRTF